MTSESSSGRFHGDDRDVPFLPAIPEFGIILIILKLLPPRPTFAQDMNGDERRIMQQHVVYWAELLKKGIAIVYGPVMDPAGAYGVGVVEVDSDEQLKQRVDNDPASGLNRSVWFPMRAVTRPRSVQQ